jgi:hypothetical protein
MVSAISFLELTISGLLFTRIQKELIFLSRNLDPEDLYSDQHFMAFLQVVLSNITIIASSANVTSS